MGYQRIRACRPVRQPQEMAQFRVSPHQPARPIDQWFGKTDKELGPAGLPRAAVGSFPYPHRTVAEVDEDRNRRAILRDLGAR